MRLDVRDESAAELVFAHEAILQLAHRITLVTSALRCLRAHNVPLYLLPLRQYTLVPEMQNGASNLKISLFQRLGITAQLDK
jgi:hypothetical protein